MRYRKLTLVATLFSIATPGFATQYHEPLPPPYLDAYIAQTPPKPNQFKIFISHLYLAGRFGVAFSNINDIKTPTPQLIDAGNTAQKTSANDLIYNKGLALGYAFDPVGGFFYNRLELEYMFHDNFKYNASPPFQGAFLSTSTLKSTIDSHTLLAKWYGEFKMGNFPLRPFIVAGFGMAHNITKSNAFFNDSSQGAAGENSSRTISRNNLAWTIGLGTAYYFNKHLSFDLDYEYIALGNVEWRMSTNASYNTAVLESNKYTANTINADIRILL